jgi:beta-galactosidase beta subunit
MVLQGFDDNEADGTAVEIDISTEVYAKISHLVQTEISKEENVRVMDSMFKDNNLLFLEFVRDVVNSNIPEIHREYADIHKETEGRGKINGEILTAVIKYTGVGDSSGKYQIIDKGEVSELILT